MGLSRLQPLQEETRKRFDAQMQIVSGIVYRELADAGLVNEPMPDGWQPTAAVGLLDPATQGEMQAITGAVLDAGIEVEVVYRSLDGARERVHHALQMMSDAIKYCSGVMTDGEIAAYLCSVVNVGHEYGLNEEKRLDSRLVRELTQELDLECLAKQATIAKAMADQLALRRPVAITPRTYTAKRAGPLSHFCWELRQPLVAVADQARSREHFANQGVELTPDEMSEPRLTFEEIAERVDETYLLSRRLDDGVVGRLVDGHRARREGVTTEKGIEIDRCPSWVVDGHRPQVTPCARKRMAIA